ncbi:YdeI/OmpD-associated family protein [Clavibacter michiganensis]|uniref:YdeI/OmpD-associated family protein n=1 Tax=Clavibacter michiganensis TaxID=28447 RepID=UPI003463F0B0
MGRRCRRRCRGDHRARRAAARGRDPGRGRRPPLAAEPALAAAFRALSSSRQRALVDPIAEAKTAETRARRVEKALAALRG